MRPFHATLIANATDAWLGRPAPAPPHILAALAEIFGEPIDHIRILERSRYARLHIGARATTRRNRILLSEDADSFWGDPELVLHEYFHVIRQWQPRHLTVARYLLECMLHGYWQNRFEIEARTFAEIHCTHFRRLLHDQSALPDRPLPR